MKSKIKYLIVFVLLLIIGSKSPFILESGEQALVQRFGKHVDTVTKSGLNFKIPFIDKTIIYDTEQVYTLQYGFRVDNEGNTKNEPSYNEVDSERLLITKGSYLLNGELIVQYKIDNVYDYHYRVDDQIGTLKLALESVVRRNVQNKSLDEALLNKEVISSEILPALKKKVSSYGLGLEIVDTPIQNIELPDHTKSAYEEVNNAKNKKDKLLEQAKEHRNKVLPEARAEAVDLVESAKQYKASKVAQAKGDVSKFNEILKEYQVAKEATKTRLYIETMEEVLSKVKDITIVDISDDGVLKHLPLSQIK